MENRVAVFIDFENIKRAVDDYFVNERVNLKRILEEIGRAAEGRIVVKRAYADWGVFKDYRSDLLDNATEPVQAFALNYKGKNGADIRIAIDVMEVVLRQPEITHVALVSGDSDFTPLVMKMREFGRFVVGVGVRSNTSNYLAKSCDHFSYYDDLRGDDGESTPERAFSATPMDPVALLAVTLADLGNRPVTGSVLKTQMRKIDPMFDETRHGHLSFLDFLRAHEELIDLYKPAVGDLVIAPRGLLGEDRDGDTATNGRGAIATNGYHPSTSAVAAAAPGQGYHDWLRDNNFRYVPRQDRHQIIGVIFDLFDRHAETGVSLKEIKDHLHGWFEQNRPFVPWDSINSTVYHLFYTWCFTFERTDGEADKQLWDRRTCLQNDIHSSHDLIVRCERGIVRKLWEHDRDLDPEALNEWLYDGDPEMLNYVTDLIAKAATIGAVRFAHGISHSSVSGHSG